MRQRLLVDEDDGDGCACEFVHGSGKPEIKKLLGAAAHEQIIHGAASAAATEFIYIPSRFRTFATTNRICAVGRLWQMAVVGAQTSAALKCLAELL